jgi:diguanylate cyclase (GGDEF)-like protein
VNIRFARSSSAFKDAIALLAIAGTLWGIAVITDAYEVLHDVLLRHEHMELDEIMLAILFLGAAGYVYAMRRFLELKHETEARTAAESKAKWIAFHDFLTKLPNRRFLDEQAPEIVKSSFKDDGYIVFAIDLDGFKKVNDLIGHDGGDHLLVTVAKRLSEHFPDSIVIRLGGDEFLAISPPPQTDDLDDFCEAQIGKITEPMKINGIHAEVGASIGYARFPEHGLILKDLAQCADTALYAAKSRGRNTFLAYKPEMNERLARRAEIENMLRHAMSKGKIVPYYQPLINLETGEIRGFEALARWQTAEEEFITPDVFIPMAEDIGLIVDLSEQLLRQSCLDALKWPQDITLAFNISPTLMVDHLLGLRIIKVLAETRFPAHRLEVEITESALVRDLELASKVIEDLHTAGISVALDDFGTGYSSLSQLSKLTFDRIKIDRSFIQSFETDERQLNIVKTVIALSRGLGISTTAEGIEQTSQLDALKQIGCSYGQGFLFGQAVPAERVMSLILPDTAAEFAATPKAP